MKLSADLYLPANSGRKLGTILIRTPYDKSSLQGGIRVNGALRHPGPYFANAGFAVVVQDVRGKFESGGEFSMREKWEVQDGYDTVEWIVHQPWSNGKVGGTGCSFPAIKAKWTAISNHPAFVTVIARGAGWGRRTFNGEIANFGSKRGGVYQLDLNVDWFRENVGANTIFLRRPEGLSDTQWDSIRSSFRLGPLPAPPATLEEKRLLPLIEMMNRPGVMPEQGWVDDLTREVGDPYWEQFPLITDTTTVGASILHIDSWYDPNVTDTIEQRALFETNAKNDRGQQQYLIISPTTHCKCE
ncbi:CocE/NonD family hydrolase, partial [Mesorhizobium sp. M2A.F.Ca.ET.042.01.1.1]|uniref:CocE/NonD family hydrolase n=1 Tax=Mesorhizobium sp. M2A.F.Ca.ET.042.01.1.1 TaxID=2496745 RepID=UPI00167AC599